MNDIQMGCLTRILVLVNIVIVMTMYIYIQTPFAKYIQMWKNDEKMKNCSSNLTSHSAKYIQMWKKDEKMKKSFKQQSAKNIQMLKKDKKMNNISSNFTSQSESVQPATEKNYTILYHNMAHFILDARRHVLSCDFKPCKWSNCHMTLDKTLGSKSDAVIYEGVFIPKRLDFKRPNGQVWIFSAFEPPSRLLGLGSKWWYANNYLFNWTMTYNKENTDIHLPYGSIVNRTEKIKRDYEAILRSKINDTLIIVSHCNVHSRRAEYVQELSKHINVKMLGECAGSRWDCGIFHQHTDECFEIINSFKFYLAFENSFCQQYFTEKIFENFNYDSIMVTRGGLPGDAKRMFPEGSFISSDDFRSAKDLALYLKGISDSEYINMLKQKDKFYSIGFKEVFQDSLCDICHKLNFQDKFRKTIKDITQWVNPKQYCIIPADVIDIF